MRPLRALRKATTERSRGRDEGRDSQGKIRDAVFFPFFFNVQRTFLFLSSYLVVPSLPLSAPHPLQLRADEPGVGGAVLRRVRPPPQCGGRGQPRVAIRRSALRRNRGLAGDFR